MIESINLQHIWRVLKKTWMIVLAVAIVMGLMAIAYTKLFVDEVYTSTISMYVSNAKDSQTGSVNANDLNASQILANTSVKLLSNKTAQKLICEELKSNNQLNVTPSYLASCVRIRQVEDTELLDIIVTTTDPELSACICNAYIKVAPGYLYGIVEAGTFKAIEEEAEPATYASAPNTKTNMIIGALAGAVITFGIAFLISLFDNSVKDADDLKKKLNLPVLGEIPTFTSNSKM